MIKKYKKILLTEKTFIKDNFGIVITKILKERKYLKRGYVLKDEIWRYAGSDTLMKKSAYNLDGEYIGESRWAYRLANRYGVTYTEKVCDEHCVVSIGFSEKENKWYGWSHRAIFGFGIGSRCKKGDCGYNAANKKDFIESCVSFWSDERCGCENITSKEIRNEEGYLGVEITWTYNDSIPNIMLRGAIETQFTPYPRKWGRGEWEAKTLADAKQMAIDFANGVS